MEKTKNAKPYLTRKNLIVIALVFFYALLVMFCGVCIDGAHIIIPKGNIINIIGTQIGLQSITAGIAGFITLILVGFYLVVFTATFLYERRFAIVNGKKPYSFGMLLLYLLTLALCAALSVGVGILIQKNLEEDIWLLLQFISNAALLGTIIYAILFGLLAFGSMLIINFLFVDKPFKFWNKKETVSFGEETEEVEKDITTSFDTDKAELEAASLAGVGGACHVGDGGQLGLEAHGLAGVQALVHVGQEFILVLQLAQHLVDVDGHQGEGTHDEKAGHDHTHRSKGHESVGKDAAEALPDVIAQIKSVSFHAL